MKHPGLGVIQAVFQALNGNLSYDGNNVPVYSSMPQGVNGYYVYLSAIRNTEDYTKTVFGGRVRFDVKIVAPMFENSGSKIGLYDIASQVTAIMRPTREGNLGLSDGLSNRMIYQEDSRELESLTPEGMIYEVLLSYVVEYQES